MNAWGVVLLWSAVQVGVFLLLGTAVYGVVRRRNPATGAWTLAAVLIAAIGLSAIAISPWPRWWSVDRNWLPTGGTDNQELVAATEAASGKSSPRQGEGTNQVANDAVTPPSEAALAGAWREFLLGFQNGIQREEEAKSWHWPAWFALAILTCVALGLMRLAVGLLAARRFAASATHAADTELLALLQELRRELLCSRSIELRVASHLGSPCTLGWLRPIVILPADWSTWSASDLRSVLAHEVAHVARGDFAVGLLAQLGAVLHFYNPLVWWLVGRLRLEQEMAADLSGARLAGGRQAYLTTLAQMALRQNNLPLLARPFFPTRGTLLRRVEMLHKQTQLPQGSISWSARIATAMLLLFVGGLVAGVRGPSESIAIAAPPEEATDSVPESDPPNMEEILAIVKASDIRLEMRQLKTDYDKLDAFIRENPDRVTPEIKQAHRHLGQRRRNIGSDIARHPEMLLAREDRKTEGVDKTPASESAEVRHARANRDVQKASLKYLEEVRRQYKRPVASGDEPVSAEEYARARRDLRAAELKLVDAESDAHPLPAWKDLSPAERHAAGRKGYLRQSSIEQLKRLGIAFQSYHDEHKRFPAAVEVGPDGKTPHSWRVALLPYLSANGEELYKRYRLDEPWDSEHNQQLIAEGAHFYDVPGENPSDDCGYFVLVGPGTVFDPSKSKSSMRAIADGTSRTLGVVEAKRNFPWTKPEDIQYSPDGPMPKLGGNFEGGFSCLFMDGSAHFIPADIEEPVLRALVSKAGREVLSNDPKTGRFKVGS
jgi:beta-lactamase regulating signal transducer with metallopeptidase domain